MLGDVFMKSPRISDGHRTLEACQADELGQMDLQALILASSFKVEPIWRHSFTYRNYFHRLETIAVGRWDDGRWNIYRSQISDIYGLISDESDLSEDSGSDSEPESRARHTRTVGLAAMRANARTRPKPAINVCPSHTIQRILGGIFSGSKTLKATCHNSGTIIEPRHNPDLTIIHHAQIEDIRYLTSNPTRIYVSTSALLGSHLRLGPRGSASPLDLGGLILSYDRDRKAVMRAPEPYSDSDIDTSSASDSDTDTGPESSSGSNSGSDHGVRETCEMRLDLEICLVSEIEGHQGQIWLAREVRDALVSYEEASRERDGTQGFIGRLKIFVDDDIPACPCCGGRR
jgi:hypothetical protein